MKAKQTSPNGKKQRKKRTALQWVNIALSILLALNLSFSALTLIVEHISFQSMEPVLLYNLECNDFIQLRNELSSYTLEQIENSDILTEYYSVALYFENISFYHACLSSDPERAAVYLAASQENLAQMGVFSYYAAQIDARFE
ncbi:MAG: hypothetical protein R3Y06_10100 [Faecalibacterium sp.]